MTFQERINDYLTQLDCTARELSAASGISAPVISRYRRGTQSPEPDMELARYLSYDASYLSRIRSGQRIPRDAARWFEIAYTCDGIAHKVM